MISEEVLARNDGPLISTGARTRAIARGGTMARVVHFEIPFDNKERAMKFYAESFDWKLDDMPQMNYVTAQSVDVDDRHMPKEARSTADCSHGRKRRRTPPSTSM
jgi:hypothetical protein